MHSRSTTVLAWILITLASVIPLIAIIVMTH
jgi:hypothetical protein